MNLIITSEQRVGSRWMHYLFAELLDKGASPEIDAGRFYNGELDWVIEKVTQYFKEDRIPKFHGVGAIALTRFLHSKGIYDFGILGVVRNPYDRAVSLAFHNRYHKNHHFPQKDLDTDEKAVIWTATESVAFRESCIRQYSDLMLPYFSTFSSITTRTNIPYIWTTYEWLKEDTVGEVQAILRSLLTDKLPPRSTTIADVVENHSFKKRSGREEGKEKRNDLWHRKGTVGDHRTWFDTLSYKVLEPFQNSYIYRREKEKSGKVYTKPVV